MLRNEWGVSADVWSVTSWNELRRDGLEADRHNLLNPNSAPRTAYVHDKLRDVEGPVIAVSDYMRAVQDQIREWIPTDYATLGTDGWGMSDTRGGSSPSLPSGRSEHHCSDFGHLGQAGRDW